MNEKSVFIQISVGNVRVLIWGISNPSSPALKLLTRNFLIAITVRRLVTIIYGATGYTGQQANTRKALVSILVHVSGDAFAIGE